MKEIGGYFELGDFVSQPYHPNAIALNTATNAVIYLIKAKKIKKIYLPYYLCECLSKIKEYCEIEYYSINKDFSPNFDIKLLDNEYLYIVNYFGMFDNLYLKRFKEIYGNIIVDNVQAFFQKRVEGIDTVYSCRKFFGVPDGAYLYTDTKINDVISKDKSNKRFIHLLGRLEENASLYFKEYRKNEELILNLDLAYMSNSTKTILNAQQYDVIRDKRTENFKYLNEMLRNSNGLRLNNIEGAYMYPYYSNNAEKIRNKLIKNKIYVPILWSNVLQQDTDKIAYDYAANIIPLPCDQRYNKKDMEKIIKIIKEMK